MASVMYQIATIELDQFTVGAGLDKDNKTMAAPTNERLQRSPKVTSPTLHYTPTIAGRLLRLTT